MYNKYVIRPIRKLLTKDGNELVESTDPHDADGYMLEGHYVKDDIPYADVIYEAATFNNVRYIYEQITGVPYE